MYFDKNDYNEVAESNDFTPGHRVGNKIAALILGAPAGGLFNDVRVGLVSSDCGRATFSVVIEDEKFPYTESPTTFDIVVTKRVSTPDEVGNIGS